MLLQKILELIRAALAKEPAVIIGLLVSIVVLVAGSLGIVLDSASITSVLAPLVTSVLVRPLVTPASSD